MLYLSDVYQPGELATGPNLFTFEGTARSGKGTSSGAVGQALRADGRSVLLIDRGQKFRTLTLQALEDGINLSDDLVAQRFLEADDTYDGMLQYGEQLRSMMEDEVQKVLYADRINSNVASIAKHEVSQTLAANALYDEVKGAAGNGIDTVIIDGRTLESHAKAMHAAKLGVYVAGFYFQCDSMMAARRVLEEYRDLKDIPDERQKALLVEADKINRRNDDDANRDFDPMRYPDHAYNLDLLRGLPEEDSDERVWELGQMALTRVIAVQTSHTKTKEQMTGPVVEISRYLLQDADLQRKSWNMVAGIQRSLHIAAVSETTGASRIVV
jgi:cytidylate kinase